MVVPQRWVTLYQLALLELDPGKMLARLFWSAGMRAS
jgi:hypothetical protein